MQFSSHKVNQKIKLLEVLFFQILQNFERTITVLGEKLFSRVIKIENCSLRLKRSIKKPNFWKFSFFSNSSEIWTNIYCAWRESFRQGYQNWKMQFSSHQIYQKNKLSEVLFFSTSSKLRTNNYRAWRKTFQQGYQNWKLQSSSHKIKQVIKLLKNLFFFKIFRTLNEHLPCLAKKFWSGVSKLKNVLYVFRVSIWA